MSIDTFTGADGTVVSSQGPWDAVTAGTNVAQLNGSGGVKASSQDELACGVLQNEAGVDHFAEVVLGADWNKNSSAGPYPLQVRCSSASRVNSYVLIYTSGILRIRRAGATSVNLDSWTGTVSTGDTLRLEAENNVGNTQVTLRAYVNGTLRITSTDATYLTQTQTGFRLALPSGTTAADFIREWNSGPLGDTTIPTLTGVITEVSKTENSISISWPAGSDNVAVTSYEVSNNAGTSYTDVGNVLAHTFTSLTASTLYALRVRAKDGAGLVSTPALALSVTTLAPDTTIPVWPGGTTLDAGTKTSTSVALSTSAAATDNVAVTGYEWSSDDGATYPFTSLSNSFTFTALTALTSYNFRVRAYDGAGNRSVSLALTTSTYRAGDTGQNIFDNTGAVGGNPEGFLRNKVTLPADAAKWFSYVITTPPATGSFSTLNPNGTFVFTGPNSETMLVQLEVDGANFGSPFLVTLYDVTSQTATPGNVTSVVAVTPSACTQGFAATPGPVTSLVSVTPSACTQTLPAAVVLPLNITSVVTVSPSLVRVLTLDASANRLRIPADGNTRRYLGKFFKRPVEMDDYDVEAADYLATVEDTLISAEVTADPGITVDAFRLVGSFVKVWVSGGVKRGRYKLTVRVTTAEGRIKELKFMVVMPAG